ncbi:hypothetical protein LINPERPRIM_LOCUS38025 [Linum perenne]
MVTAPLTLLW